MYIDSHCHLDYPALAADTYGVLARMREAQVTHALCVAVNLEDFPRVHALATAHPNLYASVGVHPDQPASDDTTTAQLLERAALPRVVAIGETGLDYFRLDDPATPPVAAQQERFRRHVRAAVACGKPLIVHTRVAAEDTLTILREEGAASVGGVMHCFTETLEVARAAMALGFMISFSGIVTFRNAAALKEVAREIPLDRLLIETDSPYLAPVPHRGRTNEPSYVPLVAQEIARLRSLPPDAIAAASTRNFWTLFKAAT
ncbi:MAG: TatD family hydrolase [bacterium]|jgi:TatD DNase family protein|nr:TatD family hydrolase [Betaproteobacteria bacterium]